jgi:hypothetical protein
MTHSFPSNPLSAAVKEEALLHLEGYLDGLLYLFALQELKIENPEK